MRKIAIATVFALIGLTVTIDTADARKSYGACDGFHRCRCGTTAASRHGIPYAYNGFNLKRAVEWVRAFPRTSFGSGVVAYVPHGGPSGHVMTVEGGADCAHATVSDDKGTYTRNVCHATFVAINNGPSTMAYVTPTKSFEDRAVKPAPRRLPHRKRQDHPEMTVQVALHGQP